MKWCLDNSISAQVTTPVASADLMNALISALESNTVTPAVTEHNVIYRILIAEDNMVNQKLAVKILEKYGHSVDIADNGQMAVDSFVQKAQGQEPYDVILVSPIRVLFLTQWLTAFARWTCPCLTWVVWRLRSTSEDTRTSMVCTMYLSSH